MSLVAVKLLDVNEFAEAQPNIRLRLRRQDDDLRSIIESTRGSCKTTNDMLRDTK